MTKHRCHIVWVKPRTDAEVAELVGRRIMGVARFPGQPLAEWLQGPSWTLVVEPLSRREGWVSFLVPEAPSERLGPGARIDLYAGPQWILEVEIVSEAGARIGTASESSAPLVNDPVELSLSRDQALVLHDYAARLNVREDGPSRGAAERRVLWDLEAMLESQLVEPFEPDYADKLAAARARARDPEDS